MGIDSYLQETYHMLDKSIITTVSSPFRMFGLKLNSLVSSSSGWMDVSSKAGKMLLFRFGSRSFLYVSPRAKSTFLTEFDTNRESIQVSPAKRLIWRAADDLDTFITQFYHWVKNKFKTPKKEKPATFGDILGDDRQSKILRDKRKRFIEKVKKGKFAKKIDTLNNSEFTGSIPSMKSLDEQLRNETLKSMRGLAPSASRSEKDIEEFIQRIKSGSLAERIKAFDKAEPSPEIVKKFESAMFKSFDNDTVNTYNGIDLNPDKYERQ